MTASPQAEIRDLDEILGQVLRWHRQAAGLTQSQLATACGISSQQLQKYEHGTNRIAASRMVGLARAMNIPVSALFTPAIAAPVAGTRAPLTARLMSAAQHLDDEPLATLVTLAEQIRDRSGTGPAASAN